MGPLTNDFQTALRLHQEGQYESAEQIYRQILQHQPDHPQTLHLLAMIDLRRGDHARAIHYLDRAIEIQPSHPGHHFSRGNVQQARGRSDLAEESYRQAVALKPEYAQAHRHLGDTLFGLQKIESAVASYRQALRLAPEDPIVLNNLGSAYHRQGQLTEAVDVYRGALRLAPLEATTHFNLGVTLRAQGEIEAAIASYRKAINLDPGMIEGFDNLGNLFKEEDRLDEALLCFQQGLEVQPDHIPTLDNMGRLLMKRKEPVHAEQCFRQILTLDPVNVAAHSSLGYVLLCLERTEVSAAACKRAIELDPQCKEAHLNFVETLLVQGKLDEVASHCHSALQIDPHSGVAHYHLANLHSGRVDEEKVTLLTETLEKENLPTKELINAHFAMGIIFNQREQYDLAFEHYHAGNTLREVNYEPKRHEDYFSHLIESFSEELFNQPLPQGSDSETPIFIVGMPRSGTTLVEQILASHPLVQGAGEIRLLQDLVDTIPARLERVHENSRIAYRDSARHLNASVVQDLANDYLRGLSDRVPEALRITDKMPENFHHLGLITLLFPRSKVIHCRRDPLDTCLSCFFQKFSHVRFSFNLEHIGAYYHQYQRLMGHWNRALPIDIHEVSYEAMIEDREQVSRDLIEYCGLPWNNDCTEFYNTSRPINTASVLQVRRPIYRSSVQRWRHYEKHLGPLKRALGWEAKTDS